MADSPRRWAKVLVVDGVMAVIQHLWDSDTEQYVIRCTIQTTAAEFSTSLGLPTPFPQEVFDRAGEDLVRGAVQTARVVGLEPELVSDGDNFTSLLSGSYIHAPTIQHQVKALDLALNGRPTPGVTLGMLLHQQRNSAHAWRIGVLRKALETIRDYNDDSRAPVRNSVHKSGIARAALAEVDALAASGERRAASGERRAASGERRAAGSTRNCTNPTCCGMYMPPARRRA